MWVILVTVAQTGVLKPLHKWSTLKLILVFFAIHRSLIQAHFFLNIRCHNLPATSPSQYLTCRPTSHPVIRGTGIPFTCNQPQYLGHRCTRAHCHIVLLVLTMTFQCFFPRQLTRYRRISPPTRLCCLIPGNSTPRLSPVHEFVPKSFLVLLLNKDCVALGSLSEPWVSILLHI